MVVEKILQVLPELESGGVERGVVDIASYGKRNGVEVLVASSGGKLVKVLEDNKVKHVKMNLKTKNPFKIILNIFKLKKLIKHENIKIVHARSRAPAWSAYYACKLSSATFITTFHGFYKFSGPIKKWYNSVMVKGEAIIAVSRFIKAHMVKNYNIKGKNIDVIHRGVNLAEFDPNKVTDEDIKNFQGNNGLLKSDFVIFLPGRVTRWKGQDIAIKALAKLKNIEGIKLLVGGGWKGHENFYKELMQLCNKYKLQQNVIFAGHINNMKVAYCACDITLNTSIEPETFGRVSAEANAMGKVVIACNHGGQVEILENTEVGILVEPANEEELAEAILKFKEILSDEERKEKLKDLAIKNTKDNFSLNTMWQKTFEVYKRYLD